MSAVPDPRPGSVPQTPLRLRIWHVPDEGTLTVLFLGGPLGIWTHGPSLRFACPGAQKCKECGAAKKAVWKGFAPVHVWVEDVKGNAWLPSILEVSDRLAEYLGTTTLRGTVWCCYRQVSEGKRKEVAGHLVDSLSPSEIDVAHDVTAVVQRAYGTPHIEFGRPQPLRPRPFVRPSIMDYVPPTATAGAETAEQKHARELQENAEVKRALEEQPWAKKIHEANRKGGAK